MSRFKLNSFYKDRKIYGNWSVQSPDGILMFRCEEKKIKWYLDRGLGEIVDNNTLRLNFQPNGLGNHNKDFGLSEMVNKCVVCGCQEFLTKHHVVPICYRRYFPLEIKSHNFHDVLPLCIVCHEEYEKYADSLKLFLSKKYDAPIMGELEEYSRSEVKCIKIANTLLRDCSEIPKERIDELKSEIKSYLSIKRIRRSRLIEISNMNSNVLKRSHGRMVMDKISDIQEFTEMWRGHFIKHMNCQYLPSNWSIKMN